MSTQTDSRASALIVHAHPETVSFSTAQAHAAAETLRAQGYTVEFIDLYANGWEPVLDRSEFAPFEGPFKPQREQWNAVKDGMLPADVRTDLDAVFRADLLVLSFPLWWFSLPAILKGWMDRVFVMGGVSGGDLGAFEQAALTGRRAVVLATTGGSADAFTADGAFGDINDFLFHIHRGMFEFVGYDALEPVITYGPAHLDDARRAEALRQVRHTFGNIHHRPLAASTRYLDLTATR
ncbi:MULTISPECIES: NAD(P)H-dependent oxidoreductase [Arthrobacter]|uniref:Flavodoxin family protein n=1 Tax=Arthrobacter terricola TaxID=2547396 RepID=A0A4R5K8G2_9MICC|nr:MULTISPECIES: NAD(P)H-dependent oxidoreductase [Arthrobacter]MBT8163745.1 NAD(P)H-dependent oxidoreductase [Arthrobacter sp. GN70]TDF87192.1 flavodoxin family protein [Arthrobacter terricola]